MAGNLSVVRDDLGGLRADMGEVRTMLTGLRRDQEVVKGPVDEVVKELAAQRAVAASHNDRLVALEQRVEALQLRGQGGAGGGAEGGGTGDGSFVPAFVELEGWTTWEERGINGVTRAEAEAHVSSLREAAPVGLREHIGRVVLFQHMNSKVRVVVGEGRAREVQDWAKRAYVAGTIAPMRPGAEMRVKLQKSPEQQRNQDKFLRGLRAVEARVRVLARDPAWVEQKVAPVWSSFGVNVGDVEVGNLSRDGEWTWTEVGLRLLQMRSGAEVLANAPGRP